MELINAYTRSQIQSGADFKAMIDNFLAVQSEEFRYAKNTLHARLEMAKKLKDLLDVHFHTYLPSLHFFDVVCYGDDSMVSIMWSIMNARGIFVPVHEIFGGDDDGNYR
ncbi:hypothetical protein SAMN02799624_05389 [Paenibacillus sp. UNC496MF]|uniref:hypothetical protein n=1 Tax=Paenibacillus sp. UNC496MF TaxID=1502753 RepID=UPI0008E39EF5|nr:hypothetical protein [Paenibacillus sp. UNC496MF]SFJ65264.1 hypothetical protein SAMN02799624_05389 [Paenibacillus sp. UNC496MF]